MSAAISLFLVIPELQPQEDVIMLRKMVWFAVLLALLCTRSVRAEESPKTPGQLLDEALAKARAQAEADADGSSVGEALSQVKALEERVNGIDGRLKKVETDHTAFANELASFKTQLASVAGKAAPAVASTTPSSTSTSSSAPKKKTYAVTTPFDTPQVGTLQQCTGPNCQSCTNCQVSEPVAGGTYWQWADGSLHSAPESSRTTRSYSNNSGNRWFRRN